MAARTESRVTAFVVVAPGLESLLLEELIHLGVRDGRVRHGGVGCSLTLPQLGLAHLHLRIATRVLVRVGRFPAHNFKELESGLRTIDWAAWLSADASIDLRAASSGSQLYHEGAIVERAKAVLVGRTGEGAVQTVHLRVQHDAVTVSLDASGEPLHKRGWRQHIDGAPMRETLAAALVMISNWDRRKPLVDPFCGSGTVVIEAAMMARKMPPGRHRSFAFHTWPRAEEVRWDRLTASADADVLDRQLIIHASDTSAKAVDAVTANAARAGVGDAVTTTRCEAVAVVMPGSIGKIITNPPYGERVHGAATAGRQLASLLERSPGWGGAVIAPAAVIAGHLRRAHPAAPADRIAVLNGGIAVQLVAFEGVPPWSGVPVVAS